MKNTDQTIWDDFLGKKLLLTALGIALLTHGVIMYFTMIKTYDAYVHMFFADHYARFWFEPFDYRWYTGFLTISYPPLVHQMVALLSKIFPIKVAFVIYSIFIYEILIIGLYRFTKLFFNKNVAGIAALLTVVLSSMIETLHVYGQAPTLTGLSFLLNAMPFLYQYFVKRKPIYLVMAMSFLAVVISSHHVTAIFGMVFFIAPTVFMALADALPEEKRLGNIFKFVWAIVLSALQRYKQIILFGFITLVMAVGLIFPYWYWSKTDPITQVSIPHGSRDNFLEVTSSGLIFYVIPLALIFALLPAISYSITRKKRYVGWAVSFFLCLLLGSGGTTPLPEMILGSNAFNILTLDRFGFWASVISIPFISKYIYSFMAGPARDFWVKRFKESTHFIIAALSGFSYIFFVVFIFHLASFRPLQPTPIEILPIQNFLNRDDHMRWRYLTLGFGDQMAWLSLNSLAATVDGNYHSARRLPELTSRPVERLENAKYLGSDGMASLNDFLVRAEKYQLKYVFSNDRYYDPLLFYTGWSRTIRLENGIMVWEKGNISTIRPVVPTYLAPLIKKVWGIFPVSTLIIAFFLTMFYMRYIKQNQYHEIQPDADDNYPNWVIIPSSLFPSIFFSFVVGYNVHGMLLTNVQADPITTVQNYYNELDFQRFENAFHFFDPSPVFTLDQYLLEKSVKDGGILPSYAKLDSIHVDEIDVQEKDASIEVFTRWRTALGFQETTEQMKLKKNDNKWYIIPPVFKVEIPEEQMLRYTYTLFKKIGKRVISSFPTVKDDRVNKPLIEIKQANLIQEGQKNWIAGELVNMDVIPANVAVKAIVKFADQEPVTYYTGQEFHYNLSPKANTFFQINLDETDYMDSLQIKSIVLQVDTDVTDKGYVRGDITAYSVEEMQGDSLNINTKMTNQFTTDINIPGILIAEKDENGQIWQVQLGLHTKAVRSGQNITFDRSFVSKRNTAKKNELYPIELLINGKPGALKNMRIDPLANQKNGILILPHCFMAQEIYL
jgi:hypothetical protein